MAVQWGFHYRDKTRVRVGDVVIVSQKIADENNLTERRATVSRLQGFITVKLCNGDEIDLDMRQIRKAI